MTPATTTPSNIATLLDDGDVELWLAMDSDWQLPLFAHPKAIKGTGQKVYYCVPAIPNIQPHHHIALNTHFAPYRLNVDASFWVVDRTTLPELCVKAPGITPGYYVVWKGEFAPMQRDAPTDTELTAPAERPNEDGQRFIEFFLMRSGLFQRDVMYLFWREFKRVCMLWLGVERQPLDLGFVKIVPMPYRANWKEIVLARHKKLPAIFAKTTGAQRQALLVFFRVYDTLTHLILSAVHERNNCVHWTLDMLVDPSLRTLLIRNERDIHKTIGAEAYAGRIFEQMQSHQNYALALLAQYIHQTRTPCGSKREGTGGRSPTIVAHLPEGAIRPVAPTIPKVFAVAEINWQAFSGPEPEDTGKVMEVEVEGVPSLPNIQSQPADVRDTGDDDDQPGDGRT
jgi:hypothetical protein